MKSKIEKAWDATEERIDILNEKIDNYNDMNSLGAEQQDRLDKWEEELTILETLKDTIEELQELKGWN